tara:strand:+ start:1552 stop:1704 length:153 start_codon:yes stop_codon:yes gene_type:complete
MILSIFMAVLLFLDAFQYGDRIDSRLTGVFVGLWAPTFGILGVRAQLKEK